MKKLLSLALTFAMLLTSTVFAAPTAVTPESADEAVIETQSDEKAAELTENTPVATVTPGINLLTGKEGLLDFQGENPDISAFSVDAAVTEALNIDADPLDSTSQNKALAITGKTETGSGGQSYPKAYMTFDTPIEVERPLYITYKYYRYNGGANGTYTAYNILWLMKGGAVNTSHEQSTNSGSWKTSSTYNVLTAKTDVPTSQLYFQYNIGKTDTTATIMYIDDLAIIPAYAITYMNTDGTEYKKEYVNGVDTSGNPTNASHTLITDGPAPTEPNKQFLGWSTDGTAENVVRELTISGNADFVLYPVYGNRYLDENAVDMLGEIGELVYFENFNELKASTMEKLGDISIHNDITAAGYDSLKATFSSGYTSRNNPYTFTDENGNKYVTASFKGDATYMPGVPRFYITGATDEIAGKYFATMDIRVPEGSPFTMLSNQAYYWGSTNNGSNGHQEFGFYADRHTLTAEEKSGNWITFMTDSIDIAATNPSTPTFNFGPTYDNKASTDAYTMDFDNFAVYRVRPRTLTLIDGETQKQVVVEDIALDLSQHENLQDIENMFVGWEKQDGTIIPANTKSYVVKRDETLTAVYKPRYFGANATQLIESLGVPVELVFHSDFSDATLGDASIANWVYQDKTHLLTDKYFTNLSTAFLASNKGRSKRVTGVQDPDTGNKYYEAIHLSQAEYPPGTPRFTLKSGVIQNPNAHYFAVLDVNIPSTVTFTAPDATEPTTIPTAITQLSNQAHSSDGGGIKGENGISANYHTLTEDEYDKWVTFMTNPMNVNTTNQWAAVFNFSPQYAYGTTLEYAEYPMSFDNFSLYAIVPRTVTIIDRGVSSTVEVYGLDLDLTQHIPASPNPGMTLSGWKTDDGTFIPKSTKTYFVTADTTLTAVWTQFASSDIDFSKYGTMVMLQDFNHESVEGKYGTLADSNGTYVPDDSNLFIDKSVWAYGGITHWWGTEYDGYTHSAAEQSGNRYMTSKGANSANHNNPSFRSNRNEPFNKVGAYYAVLDMRIPETNQAVYMVNQIHNRYQSNKDSQKADYAEQYENYRPGKEPDGVTDIKGDSSKWMKLDASHKNGQWQTFITEPYIVREGQAVPHVGYNFGLVYPDGMIYDTVRTTFDMDNYAIFYLPNRTVSFNVEVNTAGTTTALVEGITLNLANYTPVTVPEGKVFQGWSETQGGAIIAGNRIDIAPDGDGKTFYAVYADEAAPKLDKTEMRVRGVQGIRTVAKVSTEKQVLDNVEFGFIVTRQAKLGEIAPDAFTIDCGLTEGSEYIKGVSFQRVNKETLKSVIVEYEGTDNMLTFAGVFKGVPDNMVDDVLVFRPYIKEGDTYTYGAVVQASVRSIAEQIYGGHTNYSFSLLDDETKAYIKKVINTPKA